MEVVKLRDSHGPGVLDIINYYIENTGFTFIENPIPIRLYEPFIATLGRVLSMAAVECGKVVGVIMFKSYSPMSFFNGAVEMGIYVHKDYIGKGIGSALLHEAVPLLKAAGKTSICSTVSSINKDSIAFHGARGFKNRGAYEGIGVYRGFPFSVIHFQKDLC